MNSIIGSICVLVLASIQCMHAQKCVWNGQEYEPGETIENNNGCSGLLCASGGMIISWVGTCNGGPEEMKRSTNCVWNGQEYAPGETIENNNGCSGMLCASGGIILSWVADCSGGPEEMRRVSANVPYELDVMFAKQRNVNPFSNNSPSQDDADGKEKSETATLAIIIQMLIKILENAE